MNYYEPRQLATSKRWHYTCRNDDRIWPVGYCANGCLGHDDARGARDHMTRYVLDHGIRLDGEMTAAEACLVCGIWTPRFAQVQGPGNAGLGPMYFLCDEHRTLEQVRERFKGIGDVWSS